MPCISHPPVSKRFGDEPYQECVEHIAMAAEVGEAVLQPFQRPRRHASYRTYVRLRAQPEQQEIRGDFAQRNATAMTFGPG